MAVEVDPTGEVYLNEEAEQIMEDLENGITYGDMEEEYGEFLTFLAVNGPDAIIREEDETVYMGEISVAGASEVAEKYSGALEFENKNIAVTAGGTAATIGSALQFFKTGDPAWFASSLLAADMSKDSTKTIYNKRKAYQEFEENKEEDITSFKDEFEGIENYDIELNETDMAAQMANSMGAQAVETDFPTPDELDTGTAFQ